jgi:hypothetical protein
MGHETKIYCAGEGQQQFKRPTELSHHTETTVAKPLRTYLRIYSLFKSEGLSTNIKLALYKGWLGQ